MMDLSPNERKLIRDFVSDTSSPGGRYGWYASILGPIVAFGVYGIVIGDVLALGLAFVCLLGVMLWFLVVSERKRPLYRSIFAKIAEAEHREG